MTTKKNTKKKTKSRKAPHKKPAFLLNIFKTILGIALLSLAVVGAIHLAERYLSAPAISPADQKKHISSKTPVTSTQHPQTHIPRFEIFPKEDIEPAIPVRPIPPHPRTRKPRIAIIVDDLGYDSHILKKLLTLDAPLTLAVLPHSPLQKKIARLAREKNMEVMLHLPMEPVEYPIVNPGPGALLVSMTPDQLIRQLESDLNAVPGIKGVNNHMGSRMTSVSTQMYQIFSILKKRNLYFVDSRTTKDTLCKPSARLLQISFAERDVFLDNTADLREIKTQIAKLEHIAAKKGYAIGICHPHTATYHALKETIPLLQAKATLVPASKVVGPVGDEVESTGIGG